MTREEFALKYGKWHYRSTAIFDDKRIVDEDFMSDLDVIIKAEVDKAMEGAYPQEFIHYLLTLDQADDSAKKNDPYPDTEAGGYVFCGKCGKML